MLEREGALDNLAKYESLVHLKHIMTKLNDLDKMSHKGNQTALCVVMDIERAIKNSLTEKQKQVVILKYYHKETNDYIAEIMNVSEMAIRKHLKGALKRISRFLTKK